MTMVHSHLIGWFLLQTLYFSSAEKDRFPRYPTVLYSETVKFEGSSDDQMCGSGPGTQPYRAPLVFKDDFSELYVGGRNVLEIVDTSSFSMGRELHFSTCTNPPPENDPCPYVKIIQQMNASCLFVCTTGTLPACYFVDTTDENLSKAPSDFNVDFGEAAPVDSNQNISWMYVTDESKLFTATGRRTGQSESPFRLSNQNGCSNGASDNPIKSDSSEAWLNNAEYVGEPFLHNGYVYFTYREYSSEDINAAGRITYSRIARVCQNDTGGAQFTQLEGEFTTFKKARLDCSLKQADDLRFEYNEIQGTYKSGKTIFAVFTTPRPDVASSAVCVYNVDEIEELFDRGELKGQPGNGLLWAALDDANKSPNFDKLFNCSELFVPLLDPDVTFLQDWALMNLPVPNKRNYMDESTNDYKRDSDAPLFVLDDVRFSQIVVDENVNNMDVMFLGTERGTVIKAYVNDSGAFLVEEVEFNMELPITNMVKGDNSQPFISNGNCMYRYMLPSRSCSNKTACECEEDPYCVCDDGNCIARTNEVGSPGTCNCVPDPPPPPGITKVRPDEPPNNVDSVHRGKPANLNFAARASEGAGLKESEVVCTGEQSAQCGKEESPMETTVTKSVCSGMEYVTVNAVISNVTSECSCNVNFTTNGDEKLATIKIVFDGGDLIVEDPCVQEVTKYDKKIIVYKFELNNWKQQQSAKCLENNSDAAYCNEQCP
ncbi:semaphorin-1A-like isoform X2 [Patiria miniata]|uniref:Sema domain-containing protein n=1 Tax=Patiria miniata TaxID=46514 RepID=A0A914AYL5_PATMI|nr:semaphorin-1A-like isoform X2 [Patiria miniata]XP_038068772.1 semaphorin-1A-like isoform X2 [Patiria miniata]